MKTFFSFSFGLWSTIALANPANSVLCRFDALDPTAPAVFRELSITHDDVARQVTLKRDVLEETYFIIPNNDGEAKRAVDILKAANAKHLHVSQQKWGATLDKEPLPETFPKGVKRIVVFEIPGPEVEEAWKKRGYDVVVVDHHYYDKLDRRRPDASLEQLFDIIGWKPNEIDRALAVNDRGYIPGMKAMNLSPATIGKVREYDILSQGKIKEEQYAADLKLAHDWIPKLPKLRNGTYVLGPEVSKVYLIGQELANQSPTGIVNTMEMVPDKIGFSGNPKIAEALRSYDFTKLGYEAGSFKQYAGGDPNASMFFGFKPSKPPAGETELIPASVREKITALVEGIP